MRARRITWVAGLLLLLCAGAWVRSYLPEYATVRAYRGSCFLIFYDQQQALRIDPARNPSLEDLMANPAWPRPPRRWDTRQILGAVRSWSGSKSWLPNRNPIALSAAGFEVVANRNTLAEGFFVAAVPFWVLSLVLAGTGGWAAFAWRRQRAWRRDGRCRRCGYDLRATTGVCPECGTAAVTPAEPDRRDACAA